MPWPSAVSFAVVSNTTSTPWRVEVAHRADAGRRRTGRPRPWRRVVRPRRDGGGGDLGDDRGGRAGGDRRLQHAQADRSGAEHHHRRAEQVRAHVVRRAPRRPSARRVRPRPRRARRGPRTPTGATRTRTGRARRAAAVGSRRTGRPCGTSAARRARTRSSEPHHSIGAIADRCAHGDVVDAVTDGADRAGELVAEHDARAGASSPRPSTRPRTCGGRCRRCRCATPRRAAGRALARARRPPRSGCRGARGRRRRASSRFDAVRFVTLPCVHRATHLSRTPSSSRPWRRRRRSDGCVNGTVAFRWRSKGPCAW